MLGVRKKKLIGAILVEAKALDKDDLSKALLKQKSNGARLGKVITSMGLCSEETVTIALSKQLGVPMANLDEVKPSSEILDRISENLAIKHAVFPMEKVENVVKIAMAEPQDLSAIEELTTILGCEIEPFIASESRIIQAIDDHYSIAGCKTRYPASQKKVTGSFFARENSESYNSDPLPVSQLVDAIINRAIRDRASDIHIEPEENDLGMRHRIDGSMFKVPAPPKNLEQSIVSRIKILAKLDISETRLPQEGHFKFSTDFKSIELRVSTFPTIYGEAVVVRILDPDSVFAGLEETGLACATLENFQRAIFSRQGIVITTGPTGSGKTTTLYATLGMINSSKINIVTIEDPVEYSLKNVRQTQVNLKTGLTFARGLRSMLRQDPDVIMVGEIRDDETAQIATRAAMTGHLVLSTMHTNDCAGVVTRLLDLGVETRSISATLKGVLMQRLVRKICPNCKIVIIDKGAAMQDEWSKRALYKGSGCPLCKGSGYFGRTGVFEYMEVNESVVEKIARGEPVRNSKDTKSGSGSLHTIYDDCARKVINGETTLEELKNII